MYRRFFAEKVDRLVHAIINIETSSPPSGPIACASAYIEVIQSDSPVAAKETDLDLIRPPTRFSTW
jgi:hypothetical protein